METQFILTADQTVRAATDAEEAVSGSVFSSETELRRLLRDWQMRLLVELWNRLPGVRPVAKFENRDIAIARLWRALQPPTDSTRHRPRVQRRKASAPPKPGSKADSILTLLQQPERRDPEESNVGHGLAGSQRSRFPQQLEA